MSLGYEHRYKQQNKLYAIMATRQQIQFTQKIKIIRAIRVCR